MIDATSTSEVILKVDDLPEATAFYRGVLGLNIMSATASLVTIDTGSFMLYLEAGTSTGPVFEYLVGDFAKAKRALLDAGCMLVEEDIALPRCYLRDPYGIVFNLAQRRPAPARA